MALPNPFRRHNERTRSCWGYTFDLTEHHPTPEEMEPMKHTYDVLAEDCLTILDDIRPPSNEQSQTSQYDAKTAALQTSSTGPAKPPKRDLYKLLAEHHTQSAKLEELWTRINTVPDWVDWRQIARGQDVFYRYAGPCFTGLAYQSLLGGMGAARVVETLARTGGFSTRVARRRMFETTQHILQCTKSLESLQPGGEGFASSVRVRFLHAAVRRRILKLAKEKAGYFDVAAWGVPINDLDSIATIGTFSATLIWVSLPRQGIFLRKSEVEDYVALWRYIGHVMGAPDKWLSTPVKAKAMMESLLMTEIQPSPTSGLLANNIIRSLAGQPPGHVSEEMLAASARWLNGQALGDALGLARPGIYYYMLMAGQCVFFMMLCYCYRAFDALDRRKNEALKRLLYQIIVESKHGLAGEESMFEFQYVPELWTVTEQEDENERAKRRKEQRVGAIETRNMKWFLIGMGVMVACAWVGLRLMLWLWSHLIRW